MKCTPRPPVPCSRKNGDDAHARAAPQQPCRPSGVVPSGKWRDGGWGQARGGRRSGGDRRREGRRGGRGPRQGRTRAARGGRRAGGGTHTCVVAGGRRVGRSGGRPRTLQRGMGACAPAQAKGGLLGAPCLPTPRPSPVPHRPTGAAASQPTGHAPRRRPRARLEAAPRHPTETPWRGRCTPESGGCGSTVPRGAAQTRRSHCAQCAASGIRQACRARSHKPLWEGSLSGQTPVPAHSCASCDETAPTNGRRRGS